MPNAGTKSSSNRERFLAPSSKSRARLSNGHPFPTTVDGRDAWPRRYRDLLITHVQAKGGIDNVTPGELAIIKRAVGLEVSLEQDEAHFARNNGGEPWRWNLYQRKANSMRRLLQALGLERRAKDITPPIDPLEYARRYRERRNAEDAEIVDGVGPNDRTRCVITWNVATPSSSKRWRRCCASIARSKC
jgi:hypothetical protein